MAIGHICHPLLSIDPHHLNRCLYSVLNNQMVQQNFIIYNHLYQFVMYSECLLHTYKYCLDHKQERTWWWYFTYGDHDTYNDELFRVNIRFKLMDQISSYY